MKTGKKITCDLSERQNSIIRIKMYLSSLDKDVIRWKSPPKLIKHKLFQAFGGQIVH